MRLNFLCVGFPRCGTTTLYNILYQHENIYLSALKEPVFYGNKEFDKKDVNWYYRRYFGKNIPSKMKLGEINPNTNSWTSAKQLYKDYGKDLKLIFIVRNPVTRLFSDFKMNLARGTCFPELKDHCTNDTSRSFTKFVKQNLKMVSRKRGRIDPLFQSSQYHKFITECEQYFGRDHIKVIVFEEFIKSQKEKSEELFQFLNIKNSAKIDFNIRENVGNRVPRGIWSIKATRFWMDKIWVNLFLKRIPFVSYSFCRFMEKNLYWKVFFGLLTKQEENIRPMEEETKRILEKYFNEEKKFIENYLSIDLSDLWFREVQ